MSQNCIPPQLQDNPEISVSLDRLRHQLSTPTRSSSDPSLFFSDPPIYSMSASDSYIISDMAQPSSDHEDDLDSLPSISSGVLSSSEADSAEAQREWEESLEQVQLLLTMVVVPFAGKYLGRKFAYWSGYPSSSNEAVSTTARK